MKFTLGWLKEHLDTDADLDAITDALTRIGLEVEGVENPGEKLADFRVAKVLTAEPHPDADKLQVLSVAAGGDPVQVVCGAPNAKAGLIGVFGPPGAYVPGGGFALKVAEIRGVTSHGMLCSVRELELGDAHEGIIALDETDAEGAVGQSYPDYAGLTDPVIDVAITPNRQDCMGVRGIARDLAAAGVGTLKPLEEAYGPLGDISPVDGEGDGPDVRIEDSEGCPAFYAQSVSGLKNCAAPAWMARRLTAIGQKPISVLVDITNFVMNDLGRPLHVYDRAKLNGALVARKAKAGESVHALNDKEYTLDDSMTVIADETQVHDIGGIMGGEDSGVSAETTDVLIECAYFDPDHIARTGQKLVLTSDARQRFERGVDPAFLEDGLAIATRLVIAHCSGTASGITKAGKAPVEPRAIPYDPDRSATLGGLAIAADRQKAILEGLGFTVGNDWQVSIPSWRRDIHGPADLVEEVIRIEGIDAVPSVPLDRAPGVARPTATAEQKQERKLRRSAAMRGFHEAVTWSFLSEDDAKPFGGGAWTLANPISEDMKVMRPSLLPGLLAAARRNLDRGADSVMLFEIGRRYLADAERQTLTLVMAGDRTPRGWRTGKALPFDAFDAKTEAMALLDAAGIDTAKLMVMGEAGETWHPGQSATLRLGPKNILAAIGIVHPAIRKAFGIDVPVAAAEIHLDAIPEKRASGFMRPAYAPPALQAVTRDFAFLVPVDTPADTLVRAVKGADKKTIVEARLFDRFTGLGVAEGQKSLAIEVTLQPADKSFTEEDLKAIGDRIVAAAKKQGATLRG